MGVLLLLSLILASVSKISHRCIHDTLVPDMRNLTLASDRRALITFPKLVVPDFEPIRITLDTYNLDTDLSGDPRLTYLKTIILPQARSWISRLLSVAPQKDPLVVSRSADWCQSKVSGSDDCRVAKDETCNVMTIPPAHLESVQLCTSSGDCRYEPSGGSGVDSTDFIMYVGSKSDDCDAGVVAYAIACLMDPTYFQPLVGMINLCSSSIVISQSEVEQDEYVHVLVHEMFHALGFSSNSFPFFMYHDGLKRASVVREVPNVRSHTVNYFVTENAKNVALWHLGCDSSLDIHGIELEDGNGQGTAGSHTEMRVYRNDFMNGHISHEAKFSSVSLQIMEDSGWYRAQFENAEPLYFGKGAGCQFGTQACLSGDKANPTVNGPPRHFCKTNFEEMCTASRYGIGRCEIQSDPDIPSYNQYFTDPTTGGLYNTMDFCPYYQQFFSCRDALNMPANSSQIYGQFFGSNSRCLESRLVNGGEGPMPGTPEPKCFEITCDLASQSVSIQIYGGKAGPNATTTIVCSAAEGLAAVMKNASMSPWIGSVRCPVFSEICLAAEDVVFEPSEDKSNLMLYVYIGAGAIGGIVGIACLCLVGWIVCACCCKKGKANRSSSGGGGHRRSRQGHRHSHRHHHSGGGGGARHSSPHHSQRREFEMEEPMDDWVEPEPIADTGFFAREEVDDFDW